MDNLPLFPLNTVLFPGLPLQLHIFEERYKQMIALCIKQEQPFGVVLIKRGVEALGPLAEPFLVGCTARIQSVQKLNQGRMNIIIIGIERFKTLHIIYGSQPFLSGKIMQYPLENDLLNNDTENFSLRMRSLFTKYIQLLEKTGDVKINSEDLPVDLIQLGYLMAGLLEVPQMKKQELLSTKFASDFFKRLKDIYRREIALISSPLEEQSNILQGVFSRN